MYMYNGKPNSFFCNELSKKYDTMYTRVHAFMYLAREISRSLSSECSQVQRMPETAESCDDGRMTVTSPPSFPPPQVLPLSSLTHSPTHPHTHTLTHPPTHSPPVHGFVQVLVSVSGQNYDS